MKTDTGPHRSMPRLGLLAVLAVAAPFACLTAVPVQAQPQGVPVTIAKTERQDMPIWLRGLGTVQANFAAGIRPRVDGTLTQVPVKEGEDVKKGQLLAVIDPRPYQAALDAAMAKKAQDQAHLANAKADLERYNSLVKRDFASRQQVETQESTVKQVMATIQGDDAQIEAAQLNLSFCYITAPFDGRVGLRTVDPGNVVRATESAPIMTVTQVQPISVTFTLPQDNLPRITAAMAKGKLEVVAYAADDTTLLDRGTLITVDNAIDTATGTIKLKATFPNEKRTLWPGQFVRTRLLLGIEPQVVTAPAMAVQHGPKGLYVYQVKPDNTVAVQPITVSREEAGKAVIADGLTEGVPVVVAGHSRLQAGAKVAAREATPAAPPKTGS
ncbi:MAG: efflux RND transporter periplasmic adaptor subunit [Proteobacteria bacterium]|nr:efflux RND transporter periplasmic adaptor subunit [Pseudomonadota bacterium]